MSDKNQRPSVIFSNRLDLLFQRKPGFPGTYGDFAAKGMKKLQKMPSGGAGGFFF